MTKNKKLLAWVKEVEELCEPDRVYWCDGSEEENQRLLDEMVASGAAVKLIQAKREMGGDIDAAFLVNRTSGATKLSKLVKSGEWNTYEGIEKLETSIGNRAVFATAMTDGLSVLDYSDAKAKEEVQAVVQELKEAKWL